MIAIRRQSTVQTKMPALSQRLANLCPTETCLTCTTRINFHEQPTSLFRFVGQHISEYRPRRIVNGLGKPSARQSLDIQVFYRNQPVLVNNLARFFVQEIAALIADVVVESLKQHYRFPSAIRSLLP